MAGHAVTDGIRSSPTSTSPHTPKFSTGDIVGTFTSPMEAFYNAVSSSVDLSRCERSTIRSRGSQGERKLRPAIIRDIRIGVDVPTSYELSLLASFSSTPFEALHENTKDLVLPVASLENENPETECFIRTEPPWPKKVQYVVTRQNKRRRLDYVGPT
ncbi:hypothetical protein K435DRAFT_774631 [Dendrothele bispora CBS 962.96]|uniref:Uncharacterized protein n=1 Tax=Dendrothele bispora (strain CBS 962.96) TaxID=1314807 RepID=A0A4S8MMJ0_DENBC|nr:hypothetical protein K435DRAFT_774631 [Dendrothele bispora CBS 962.96]